MGSSRERHDDQRFGGRASADPRDARLSFTPRDDGRARLIRRIGLPVATLLVALLIMLWPKPSTPAPDPAREGQIRAVADGLVEDARLGRTPTAPIGASEPIVSDLVRGHLAELLAAGGDGALSVDVVTLGGAHGAEADRPPSDDGASHLATIRRGERSIELRISHRGELDGLAIVGIEVRTR